MGDGPRIEVTHFFDDQLAWLERELSAGIESGHFRRGLDVGQVARLLLASLEGAMLMSRAGSPADLATELGGALLTMVEAA